MKVALIGPEALPKIWPLVEAMLLPAIEQSGGRYTVDSTRHAISAGDMQLWVAYRGAEIFAAMTSSVVVYPSKKMLCVVHCGGRMMGLWLQTMRFVEGWARAQGCDGIELIGRPGWAKALGYEKTGALIERCFA